MTSSVNSKTCEIGEPGASLQFLAREPGAAYDGRKSLALVTQDSESR